MKVLGIWSYYFTVAFFCVVIYVYDMTIMVVTKEVFTPLSTFFNSIVRREKETDESVFRKITGRFHKNAKLGGGQPADTIDESKSMELAKPLTTKEDVGISNAVTNYE